jgi:hypothetical protein
MTGHGLSSATHLILNQSGKIMNKTTLAIDGHVHIYPKFDLIRAVTGGRERLISLCKSIKTKDVQPVWFLAERSDCFFFEQLMNNELDSEFTAKYRIEETRESSAVSIVERDKQNKYNSLLIVAGQQVIAQEGLEISMIGTVERVADRKWRAEELLDKADQSAGFAVLNWAPGKWFFGRGNIVKSLLSSKRTSDMIIGDTTMRTKLWPTPNLMAQAASRGFRIIAGSDPLPFTGEEDMIGSYGFCLQAEMRMPVQSIKKALFSAQTILTQGSRSGLLQFIVRQRSIMIEKQQRKNK